MMWCECRDCMGDEDSLEPCINAQMEAEIKLKKSEMNRHNFWIWFLVIMVIMFLAGAFVQ